jgi:hypothetical protein
MAGTTITGLGAGTPKATDLHVAVDTTDTTMAPSGTDKKYTLSGLATFILGAAMGSNTVYVASTGTDAVTNGTILSPYATVSYAMAHITTATATNPFTIQILSGQITDSTQISWKPYVSIKGETQGTTLLNNTLAIVADPTTWTANINGTVYMQDLTVGQVTMDFSAISGSGGPTIEFDNVFVNNTNTIITKGTATINPACYMYNSFSGNIFIDNASLFSQSNQYNVINIGTTSVIGPSYLQSSGDVFTSITAISANTLSAPLNSSFYISGAIMFAAPTFGGSATNCNVFIDASSLAAYTPIIASGAPTITKTTAANSVFANYASPTHYTPVDTSVNGHLQGINAALGTAGTGFLLAANNLSDVASVSTSRTNLGLGTMALQNANAVAITGGTINGTTVGATTPASLRATAITETTFATAGIVHNAAGGLFSSGLIVTADVTNNAITNAKLAQMAANTIKGNNTGVLADPIDLTVSQVQTMINGSTGTLGTMAYENSNSIIVTGGTMSGVAVSFGSVSSTQISGSQMNSTTIGGVIPSTGAFTSLTETTFGTAGVVHNNASGVFSSSLIVAADISSMPLTSNQIAFGSGSNTLTSSANITWNNSSLIMSLATGSELNIGGGGVLNRKLVLFGAPGGNNFQFYGIGVQSNAQQYVTLQSTADHVFLCGASSSSFSELARIKGTGGIQLPTVGGTAASLTYYEESTTITMTLTGPWGATTSTLPVTLSRVGNIVTMTWGDSSPTSRVATSTSTITTSTGTAIPARFLPAGSASFYVMPVINFLGSNTGSFGSFFFSSGVMIITSAINAQFTTGNNVGVIGSSISWLA